MFLAELADFVVEIVTSGRYFFVSSLDIGGAFDTAPHHLLVSALDGMGVGGHILRYMGRRFRGRGFRVRLRTPVGPFKSRAHPIERGLPPGGVLSSLLRLVFFNDLPSRLAASRGGYPEAFRDVAF